MFHLNIFYNFNMSNIKRKIILMILAALFSQLYAQNPNFRFATTTTTNQVVDSIIAIGTATIPYVGTTSATVSKTICTLDNGYVSQETNYFINLNNLSLSPVSKKTYTYTINNILDTSITAKWDTTLSVFIDSIKSEYIYPVNDICIEKIYKINGSVWQLSDSIKTVTTYNPNQDATEKITSASRDGVWVDSIKETSQYDASFRLTEKIISLYNGSAWENFKKTVLTYNVDNKTASAVLYDGDGVGWTPSTFSLNGIQATVNTTVHYSMINRTALPVIENAIEAVKTYPNPTVDGFYVNAGDSNVRVSVISVSGELLIEKEVTGTEYIRVNTIGKGTFLVKISSNGKSITKKLYVK